MLAAAFFSVLFRLTSSTAWCGSVGPDEVGAGETRSDHSRPSVAPHTELTLFYSEDSQDIEIFGCDLLERAKVNHTFEQVREAELILSFKSLAASGLYECEILKGRAAATDKTDSVGAGRGLPSLT